MKRELVSAEYLQQWLTSELQKCEDCADCKFCGINALRGTDETGCNWSNSALSCSGTLAGVCAPHVQEILLVARSRYNLKSK